MKTCRACKGVVPNSSSVCLRCGTGIEPRAPERRDAGIETAREIKALRAMDTAAFVVPAGKSVVRAWAVTVAVVLVLLAGISLLTALLRR